jgi:hypothetical protein
MIDLVSSCWQIRDYKRLDTIQNYIRPSHFNEDIQFQVSS